MESKLMFKKHLRKEKCYLVGCKQSSDELESSLLLGTNASYDIYVLKVSTSPYSFPFNGIFTRSNKSNSITLKGYWYHFLIT